MKIYKIFMFLFMTHSCFGMNDSFTELKNKLLNGLVTDVKDVHEDKLQARYIPDYQPNYKEGSDKIYNDIQKKMDAIYLKLEILGYSKPNANILLNKIVRQITDEAKKNSDQLYLGWRENYYINFEEL